MKPSPRENAEVSLGDQRRQSAVEKHLVIYSLLTPDDHDEIDEAAADPIHDHVPQAAPQRKVRGVLGILDELDRENSNRRFNY